MSGFFPCLQGKFAAGSTEHKITLILFWLANSAIEEIFPATISKPLKRVFPAISFVPARITTTLGFKLMTSVLKRTSISVEV